MAKYEKTGNKNIFKKAEERISEVHLDKLENQIVELTAEKDAIFMINISDKYPDDIKTLISEHNAMQPDKTRLIAELNNKKKLVTLLKEL